MFFKSHVIGGEPIAISRAKIQTPRLLLRNSWWKNPTLCPTRESNSGPLAQQSRLQLLDQRGSPSVVVKILLLLLITLGSHSMQSFWPQSARRHHHHQSTIFSVNRKQNYVGINSLKIIVPVVCHLCPVMEEVHVYRAVDVFLIITDIPNSYSYNFIKTFY